MTAFIKEMRRNIHIKCELLFIHPCASFENMRILSIFKHWLQQETARRRAVGELGERFWLPAGKNLNEQRTVSFHPESMLVYSD